MALSNNVYGSVGTPRVYVDYLQYAKAIGYVIETSFGSNTWTEGNPEEAFDFNPVNIKNYTLTAPAWYTGFVIHFKTEDRNDKQFSELMKTQNYYGFLGHRFGIDNNGLQTGFVSSGSHSTTG